MQDDENEFEHLNRDSMELDLEQPEQRPEMEEDEEDEEESRIVNAAQLREELRKAAQKRDVSYCRSRGPSSHTVLSTLHRLRSLTRRIPLGWRLSSRAMTRWGKSLV